jgi:hypothetical protein
MLEQRGLAGTGLAAERSNPPVAGARERKGLI